MISNAMKPFLAGSSTIRAMFEEGKRMVKQYGAENVFDFSLGNPSVPTPAAMNESMINVINNTDTASPYYAAPVTYAAPGRTRPPGRRVLKGALIHYNTEPGGHGVLHIIHRKDCLLCSVCCIIA